MKYLKFGLIFLGVLLLVFMVQGMLFGITIFLWVIKLMIVAGIIGLFIYLFNKNKKNG